MNHLTWDELWAMFDGEWDGRLLAAARRHLEVCEDCAQKYDSIQRAHQAIVQSFQQIPATEAGQEAAQEAAQEAGCLGGPFAGSSPEPVRRNPPELLPVRSRLWAARRTAWLSGVCSGTAAALIAAVFAAHGGWRDQLPPPGPVSSAPHAPAQHSSGERPPAQGLSPHPPSQGTGSGPGQGIADVEALAKNATESSRPNQVRSSASAPKPSPGTGAAAATREAPSALAANPLQPAPGPEPDSGVNTPRTGQAGTKQAGTRQAGTGQVGTRQAGTRQASGAAQKGGGAAGQGQKRPGLLAGASAPAANGTRHSLVQPQPAKGGTEKDGMQAAGVAPAPMAGGDGAAGREPGQTGGQTPGQAGHPNGPQISQQTRIPANGSVGTVNADKGSGTLAGDQGSGQTNPSTPPSPGTTTKSEAGGELTAQAKSAPNSQAQVQANRVLLAPVSMNVDITAYALATAPDAAGNGPLLAANSDLAAAGSTLQPANPQPLAGVHLVVLVNGAEVAAGTTDEDGSVHASWTVRSAAPGLPEPPPQPLDRPQAPPQPLPPSRSGLPPLSQPPSQGQPRAEQMLPPLQDWAQRTATVVLWKRGYQAQVWTGVPVGSVRSWRKSVVLAPESAAGESVRVIDAGVPPQVRAAVANWAAAAVPPIPPEPQPALRGAVSPTVQVKVVDADGNPLEGAEVRVFAGDHLEAEGVTDAAGKTVGLFAGGSPDPRMMFPGSPAGNGLVVTIWVYQQGYQPWLACFQPITPGHLRTWTARLLPAGTSSAGVGGPRAAPPSPAAAADLVEWVAGQATP
ncbi:MAG: hypothetical protein K6T30_01755 [Alicyclobacillus sp.]|nr:hypothetical protein [Alicyclobacillus sp.]